jgi:hypothetical protein
MAKYLMRFAAAMITLVCLALYGCYIERIIKQEIPSPNGSFRIIHQSVGGGTATKQLGKIFLLNKDVNIEEDTTPVLITAEDNILNVFWKDDKSILIYVMSESLIDYQVVKYYGFNILVEEKKEAAAEPVKKQLVRF